MGAVKGWKKGVVGTVFLLSNQDRQALAMVSFTFLTIAICCLFGLTITQDWPRLSRVGQLQTQLSHRDFQRSLGTKREGEEIYLFTDAPKRSVSLFTHKDEDSMRRTFRGRMNKIRKLSHMGRPRGHPLRWG
ncbi:uncharacterized protein NPIL_631551 [Nephila pilipes]|uniref:Uncharacterized protein n=1 Tax=Nephila pilipes TaxID=299642 RepID=A0A8X6QAL4_NEPPI|nr:uncharacterized protein NPIL_631551 [Nephila pilipes]